MISFELGKSLRQHFVAGQFLGLLRTSVHCPGSLGIMEIGSGPTVG
jgi:hypothetical protein